MQRYDLFLKKSRGFFKVYETTSQRVTESPSHQVTKSPSRQVSLQAKKIRADTCDTRRQRSASQRVYKSTSLQAKRYVQIHVIRGDRNLQVTKSPSRQVAKSMSKKIRVDTCDTWRLKSESHRVNESTSLQAKRYVQIPAIRGDRNLQVTESTSLQVYKQKDTCRYL